MKITLNIEAESAEDFKAAIAALSGTNLTTTMWVHEVKPEMVKEFDSITVTDKGKPETDEIIPAPVEQAKPKTRSRASVPPAPEPTPVQEETPPVQEETPVTLQTPAPADDLLGGSPAPASNSLLDTPVTKNGSPDTPITKDLVRAKISKVPAEHRMKVVELIKTNYLTDKGVAAENPSEMQEKDYADLYTRLDTLQ